VKLKAWHERELARDPEYAKAIAEIAYAQRVADSVVAERIRVGLTQEELAARAGTTQARISEIEHGIGNPTLDTVTRVMAALRAATPGLNATVVVGPGAAFLPVWSGFQFQLFEVETVPTRSADGPTPAANSNLALAA
jgi:transcriptional regulator with XRE-family HTH domain